MVCEKCNKEHDGKYGSGRFCSQLCARSFATASKREEINEKVSQRLGKYGKFISKEAVEFAIKESRSMNEAAEIMEIPFSTFKRVSIKFGLYTPIGVGWSKDKKLKTDSRIKEKSMPLEQVMVANSTYSRGCLKKRLLDAGIKHNKCEICGFEGDWNGRPIVFIIDHINGINNDHRLENLRMVCPMFKSNRAHIKDQYNRTRKLFRLRCNGKEFLAVGID